MKKDSALYSWAGNIYSLMSGHVPGQLVVQITDSCNAACPQCAMNRSREYKRSKLDIGEIKSIIDTAAVREIKSISFTGGEPFLYYPDLVEAIAYANKKGIVYTRTGTNAFFLMNSEKSDFPKRIRKMATELRDSGLRNLWISIDSADPWLHERMRGLTGVIEGIRKALPIFHREGLYPAANLGLNRNLGGYCGELEEPGKVSGDKFYRAMCNGLRAFFSLVLNLGFTMANVCYPMSISEENGERLTAVYGAGSSSPLVDFPAEDKVLLFRALLRVIPEYRHKLRIFTPLSSVYALQRQHSGERAYSYPCRGGIDFFYIEARSDHVFPCGYRGEEDLGSWADMDWLNRTKSSDCRLCDWECFRDPSELAGPVNHILFTPWGTIKKLDRDRHYLHLWLEDLRYYRACRLFDGTLPADLSRLAEFEKAVKPGSMTWSEMD